MHLSLPKGVPDGCQGGYWSSPLDEREAEDAEAKPDGCKELKAETLDEVLGCKACRLQRMQQHQPRRHHPCTELEGNNGPEAETSEQGRGCKARRLQRLQQQQQQPQQHQNASKLAEGCLTVARVAT